MFDRVLSVAVAAMALGVSPKVLRARMKKAGTPVAGGTVVFGQAIAACEGIKRDEQAEALRERRLRAEV
jgi:hypothetical protein